MQRNESRHLRPWLTWHAHLFAVENLYVIDQGSDEPIVKATLQVFETQGAHVMRLSADADYRQKGDIVSHVMAQVAAAGLHDFIFPLDCDEFIILRDDNGAPTCSRDALFAHLEQFMGCEAPLCVSENFLNALGTTDGFWPLPYQKVFFGRGFVGAVDHGSHRCISSAAAPVPTRIVYIHLHHRDHDTQVRLARQKLSPFVNVDDKSSLMAFRGPGWHLVANLLKTKQEYMQAMTGGSLQFSRFAAALRQLGVDPGFYAGAE
jgi:hypothetical protein